MAHVTERAVIRHRRSGDEFVAVIDAETGDILEISDALADSDWRDRDGFALRDLNLYDWDQFHAYDATDDPDDPAYRILITQTPEQARAETWANLTGDNRYDAGWDTTARSA